MSLSIKVIDRLFERLGATYGASWSKMWADVPLVDVKTTWAHEDPRPPDRRKMQRLWRADGCEVRSVR